jgi:hypothetical protein
MIRGSKGDASIYWVLKFITQKYRCTIQFWVDEQRCIENMRSVEEELLLPVFAK